MTIFRDDRPLLDAFRRGDRAAAERVYYHYVDDVDKLVRRGFILDVKETIRVPGIGDADAAADLVQEVFVRALSEPARLSYDGLRPYRPYLLRIAKNLLIDRLRATKNAAIVSLTGSLAGLDVEAVLAQDAPLLEEPVDLDFERQLSLAQTFLASCDDESREFVALRFCQELSQEQVAEQLGVTRRRVRTLEDRIKGRLRKFLKRSGSLP